MLAISLLRFQQYIFSLETLILFSFLNRHNFPLFLTLELEPELNLELHLKIKIRLIQTKVQVQVIKV